MVQATCNEGDSLGGVEQLLSYLEFPRIGVQHRGYALERTSSRGIVSRHRGSKQRERQTVANRLECGRCRNSSAF